MYSTRNPITRIPEKSTEEKAREEELVKACRIRQKTSKLKRLRMLEKEIDNLPTLTTQPNDIRQAQAGFLLSLCSYLTEEAKITGVRGAVYTYGCLWFLSGSDNLFKHPWGYIQATDENVFKLYEENPTNENSKRTEEKGNPRHREHA